MTSTLYYIHDPMCSWCYGFAPTWQKIMDQLPDDIAVEYVVGGLAPDSDEPMPEATTRMVKGAWHKINEMLGTEFNFDFWENNTPRRSTYPACRAVLAARAQGYEKEMIAAIQTAYYRHALNPSDDHVLIGLADELSMGIEKFKSDLNSDEINQELMGQIMLSRKLTHRGFPSLVLAHNGNHHFIEHDYLDADVTLSKVDKIIS
ncbi:DsbA family protein [Pseudemcibacter aquimaris]|uniref:DsbA family protein n=1 Tax=Pseudemcibacter aquimaris TaxID=2857064 RepID=UPI002013A246|nr:DsbA family protein [Pseudemcibacter aquimaris]MCC3860115.1 DsbA family protein [Pseudemcibacter aquimaris]WDU57443.1 DsbA family protein [Pseudemcibacter aquimaris]